MIANQFFVQLHVAHKLDVVPYRLAEDVEVRHTHVLCCGKRGMSCRGPKPVLLRFTKQSFSVVLADVQANFHREIPTVTCQYLAKLISGRGPEFKQLPIIADT